MSVFVCPLMYMSVYLCPLLEGSHRSDIAGEEAMGLMWGGHGAYVRRPWSLCGEAMGLNYVGRPWGLCGGGHGALRTGTH